MTDEITVFAFPDLIYLLSMVPLTRVIYATLIRMLSGLPMQLKQRKGSERPTEVRHPDAFHSFRTGKPDAEELLIAACQDPHSPAFTRAGAMLALRRFVSDASFDEARRNLDSNQSVIRVAAVSKLEDLPVDQSHAPLVRMLHDPIVIRSDGSCPYSFP